MNIKERIIETAGRNAFVERILTEQRYRMVMTAALSFIINVLYALYNGIFGILNLSIWFVTMCAYYTILSAMRASAVLCELKNSPADNTATEYFVAKLSGILLAILSFILTVVIYISISESIASKYGTIVMITIATYTFTKITMAIIRAVKQRKNSSMLLAVIRSIGYADVAASVLTLQRSMFASFGDLNGDKAHAMNILTGAAVCFFILVLGIMLIIKGTKNERKG